MEVHGSCAQQRHAHRQTGSGDLCLQRHHRTAAAVVTEGGQLVAEHTAVGAQDAMVVMAVAAEAMAEVAAKAPEERVKVVVAAATEG